ncbi:hypothetical protein AB833_12425 [Chromatiales bacterium (ex Bugula neritina AB1)]|nr:hypothetical protein AB833_12425 [Chromatiales bacterium (ex Bugula neritina AB1)]
MPNLLFRIPQKLRKLSTTAAVVFYLTLQVGCVSGDSFPTNANIVLEDPIENPESWVLGSYPGWVQKRLTPMDVPYEMFTHIMHFAMYPTDDGGLDIGDIFTDRNANNAVEAAHAFNTPIILVVGGEGEGEHFVGATNESNLPSFVDAIIKRVQKHGYDGVSIDWEEAVVDRQLIALIKALNQAFSELPDKPLLMVDIMTNFVKAKTAAAVEPYVDTLNIMSYYNYNKIEDEFDYYRRAGIPAGKVIMGVGLFPRADDLKKNRLRTKMQYARKKGFLGTELWSFEFVDWDSPIIQQYNNMRW